MSNATVVVYNSPSSSLIILPATSERIIEQNWIPRVGDRIVVQSTDYSLMAGWEQNLQNGKFSTKLNNNSPKGIRVITVVECVYDYGISDIGIICECLPF